MILTACEGEYGLNCNKVCGVCYGNEQCDYENGACPNGCEDGYKGSKCKTGNTKVIQPCLCKKKDRHDGCRYNSNRYQWILTKVQIM